MSTKRGRRRNPEVYLWSTQPDLVYPASIYQVDVGLYGRCSRVHTRPPRALTIGLGRLPPQQVYQVYPASKRVRFGAYLPTAVFEDRIVVVEEKCPAKGERQ